MDVAAGSARYVVPAPDGRLALLAEFTAGSDCDELLQRFQQLMASFRWADQRGGRPARRAEGGPTRAASRRAGPTQA